jgi:hypothetical protein
VLLVNKDAEVVWKYGGIDNETSQSILDNPTMALMREDGKILIADSGHTRLVEVGLDKLESFRYGNPGGTLANFLNPVAVTPVQGTNDLLVTDAETNRITEMTRSGTIVSQWSSLGLDRPSYALRLADGKTLIVNTGNSSIGAVSDPSSSTFDWGIFAPQIDINGTGFAEPNYAQVLQDGRLLVADTYRHRVLIIEVLTSFVEGIPSTWFQYGTTDHADDGDNLLNTPRWAHVVGDYTNLPNPNGGTVSDPTTTPGQTTSTGGSPPVGSSGGGGGTTTAGGGGGGGTTPQSSASVTQASSALVLAFAAILALLL